MMKKLFLLLFQFFVLLCINAQAEKNDSIFVIKESENDSTYVFDIVNNTPETWFFCDAYLHTIYSDQNRPCSKYLHRYNEKEDVYKLSLVPLVYFLDVIGFEFRIRSQSYYETDEAIIYSFLYHFSSIRPRGIKKVSIPKSCLYSTDYVYDISQQDSPFNLAKYKQIPLEFKKDIKLKKRQVMVEFAIYKDVRRMKNNATFWGRHHKKAWKQALSYSTISTIVDL